MRRDREARECDSEGAPATRREVRAQKRADRRAARKREREALKRLPRRERLAAWWRGRPLAVTFTVYLCVYLCAATAVAMGAIEALSNWNNGYYELEVTVEGGLTRRGTIDSGPYIYDPNTQELLPASELDLPGDDLLAVFIATSEWGTGSNYVPETGRTVSTIYATTDLVRSGEVQLYDWGLNYNEYYPQEEVLEVNGAISAENLARYDELSRANRVQSVELFEQVAGADLEGALGEGLVSNTAYYAASQRPAGLLPWLLALATGLAPVLAYGGLGWVMFRRFYRVHIAAPLGELSAAAERIAGQDLDFTIDPVRGRELGRLSRTLEGMRASLLEAQRALWRTAEERRRLNAAFAHDMRTPVTVLKGTVEMAKMRVANGVQVDEDQLDTLGAQAERLERYAAAMGGLTKLEDRAVERVEVSEKELIDDLLAHAARVVAARGEGLELRVEAGPEPMGDGVPEEDGALAEGGAPEKGSAPEEGTRDPAAVHLLGATDGARVGAGGHGTVAQEATASVNLTSVVSAPVAPAPDAVFADVPLVEEVLDNLLSNACGHARTAIMVSARVERGELLLRVTDDGEGFSPEALRRGRDPFYSENKSAEHFGLGLNISSILCGLHGGALELANREGLGAQVSTRFDVRRPGEDGDADVWAATQGHGTEAVHGETPKTNQGGGCGFSRFWRGKEIKRG